MKRWVMVWMAFFALLCLSTTVRAVELPEDVQQALPPAAEEWVDPQTDANGFTSGLIRIWDGLSQKLGEIVRQRMRGAAGVLLIVMLCGVMEGFCPEKGLRLLPMAGALSIALATAGSLDALMGLGTQTIGDLRTFSQALLPTLAAAAAASGAVTSATVRQVATVFFVDLLMGMIHGLLIPMVYLYVGMLTAACCLPGQHLSALAELLKKAVVWILTGSLLAFTLYLSIAGIFSGTADGAAVKVAKAAISGVVPVVGGIIAEASDTVMAGAALLRGTVGVFGVLGILAACAYPFLQLGVQYLLYKLVGFLSSVVGAKELRDLINGLGGAFGLVLGMTGSCALLLLISILASVAVVTP